MKKILSTKSLLNIKQYRSSFLLSNSRRLFSKIEDTEQIQQEDNYTKKLFNQQSKSEINPKYQESLQEIDQELNQKVKVKFSIGTNTIYDKIQTQIEQKQLIEQNQKINQNFSQFTQKYGIQETQKFGQSKSTESQADDLLEKLSQEYLNEIEQSKVLQPTEILQPIKISKLDLEIKQAQQTLKYLKEILDPNYSPILKATDDDIIQNKELRQQLLDVKNGQFLLWNRQNTEIEKAYSSEAQQRIDEKESFENSDIKVQFERLKEFQKHNAQVISDYYQGEEGIDTKLDPKNDIRYANQRKILQDLKYEINKMKFEKPATAQVYHDYFFKKNYIDQMIEDGLNDKYNVDEIVKIYPGSPKGPLPEDDPEFYSKWFMRNQPEDLIYPNLKNYRDIGVKYKMIWSKNVNEDEDMVIEIKDNVADFVIKDELFPSQSYQGAIPEFDLSDLKMYDQTQEGKMPFLRFHSHLKQDELLPLPGEHTLRYSDVQYELERWSLFTQLPQIVNYERDLTQMYINIRKGLLRIPNYLEQINPPSLWAYYYTLPSWVRNEPIIRNIMMALEYHQPGVDIRAKENALNMACSFFRPIDSKFKELIVDVIASNKIQLNMKLGNEMLNELQFYEVDTEYLGDEDGDVDGEGDDLDEEQMQKMIAQNLKNKQKEDEEESPMQAALKMMDESYRQEDMRKLMDEQMSIENYNVQPIVNQCMSDFMTFEQCGYDDIVIQKAGDQKFGVPPKDLPINYYDNDDGFWDDYIQFKQNRWEKAGLITNRKYFMH